MIIRLKLTFKHLNVSRKAKQHAYYFILGQQRTERKINFIGEKVRKHNVILCVYPSVIQ